MILAFYQSSNDRERYSAADGGERTPKPGGSATAVNSLRVEGVPDVRRPTPRAVSPERRSRR
jgi:hypothetical protein